MYNINEDEKISSLANWLDDAEILVEMRKKPFESGDDFLDSGFKKFCVQSKNSHRGRIPATDEGLVLPPWELVTFKWSPNTPITYLS